MDISVWAIRVLTISGKKSVKFEDFHQNNYAFTKPIAKDLALQKISCEKCTTFAGVWQKICVVKKIKQKFYTFQKISHKNKCEFCRFIAF